MKKPRVDPGAADFSTREFLRLHCPATERYLIGVSGGRDSVALLHMLAGLGFGALFVCHLDHGMRPESAAEAAFVKELAQRLGLPFVTARVDVKMEARRRKRSQETVAREERYAFFAKAARDHGCPQIFLAHHADDQVETFLFNLFRGAGPGGLAAMRWDSTRRIDGTELRVLRPLLGTWRSGIDAYLAAHRLDFVEDASNLDLAHTRNRLRHAVIPGIEAAFGREIRPAIWRTAEILRAEDAYLRAQTPGPTETLSVASLRALPEALQRRLIHAWLKFHAVGDAGFEEIERVRSLLDASLRPAKVNLPGGLHARRRAGNLFLERGSPLPLSEAECKADDAK